MEVFSGCVWLWMTAPLTLPGFVLAILEIVNGVVTADEPPDVDSNTAHVDWILFPIYPEFENAW